MAELSPTESQLIGSRIREARVKRRMSQAELADKAGISLPQIMLFYSIMLCAVLGLFPYLGKDFYVLYRLAVPDS